MTTGICCAVSLGRHIEHVTQQDCFSRNENKNNAPYLLQQYKAYDIYYTKLLTCKEREITRFPLMTNPSLEKIGLI